LNSVSFSESYDFLAFEIHQVIPRNSYKCL
jgi:hypothetical protein